MTEQNDQFAEGHIAFRGTFANGEEAPDVEGHIRPAHTDPEIRISSPAEGPSLNRNDEDEGPEVEGHIFLGHSTPEDSDQSAPRVWEQISKAEATFPWAAARSPLSGISASLLSGIGYAAWMAA